MLLIQEVLVTIQHDAKSNNNHRTVTVQESADSGCARDVVDNAVQLYICMLDGIIGRR